jgi:hypothetical protein
VATLKAAVADRRRRLRCVPEEAGWKAEAVLRPGLLVTVINISAYGVLLESPGRLRPGRRADIQLSGLGDHPGRLLAGQVSRCSVVRVSPILYRGVVVFDQELDVDSLPALWRAVALVEHRTE